MRKGIHPEYKDSKVICSCGAVFEVKSTEPEIRIETCSNCHPFYTGIDNRKRKAGKVDNFNKKKDELLIFFSYFIGQHFVQL